ncbi:type II toxin-antitoxin system VapC family toxin [Methylobacterium sp. SyP6R]|uniref:type II toxin-antitoxin system VapC family toxin n=1 Tax=Methylobacterium sp. SyP6R TaxID=2718876 RepID=UPI001F15A55D|nr:type II toxin-antitoxin system VapC family toxin [Methylobacterium sp. SyP6R]MCF4126459.1 type II toxin-antitoxin system VapC family toxin [Methylobacterium sp. SyP6R]
MIYLLDSNAVIGLLKGHAGLWARVNQQKDTDIVFSSVVAHELFYGAFRSQHRAASLARVDALRFPILPFDASDARRAGEVRASLAAIGTPIGPYDVLIAGQASQRGLVLVTHNLREFRRVPGLAVEDWEAADLAT